MDRGGGKALPVNQILTMRSPFRFTCGIIDSTMNRRKLDQLNKALEAARRNTQKLSDLEDLAKMAGRTEHPGGKHPIWKSFFPENLPVSIPRHGGSPDASHIVKKSVINQLEIDAASWEERISKEEQDNQEHDGAKK